MKALRRWEAGFVHSRDGGTGRPCGPVLPAELHALAGVVPAGALVCFGCDSVLAAVRPDVLAAVRAREVPLRGLLGDLAQRDIERRCAVIDRGARRFETIAEKLLQCGLFKLVKPYRRLHRRKVPASGGAS